ncbi:mucin-5AC isoform X2 [Poeciliopsis prolifica]|uniref:mucin-5AC isoform X2 n=1 Tax=Poeciliopsis prolifica TaxID=188132 RepID=UPI002412EC90|nr:mucin-5AC isoform X2 [Poeciliopsis prolifica]
MRSASQVGHRTISVSSSSIMASVVFKKDTGIVFLLLSGFLLPSVFVSGQDMSTTSSTTAPAIMMTNSAMNTTTSAANFTMTMATMTSNTTQAADMTSSSSAATTTQITMSTTYRGNMTEENKNTTSNFTMKMINCPSFSCYYSDCYSKYNSQNESYCSTGESCQLLKSMDMWYNVSCSASCVEDCNNTSQPNCSVNCCNSTGCIKDIFVPMMMTTTVAATTTTIAPTTTTTTSTTANKGNKCHKGTCTGEDCYKKFKDLETCSSTNPHCQLKKETSDSGIVWKAGCSNCTGYAPCTGTTKPPCNLECCTATTTSCLILNGTMNVPSFASRGPYLHIELITSLVCLLAITLLL